MNTGSRNIGTRTIHRLDVVSAGLALASAVDAFLAEVPNANTARSYGTALRALVSELGASTPVAVLDEEATADRIGTWFSRRWGQFSNATTNARLDALRSAAAWWRIQGWIAGELDLRNRRAKACRKGGAQTSSCGALPSPGCSRACCRAAGPGRSTSPIAVPVSNCPPPISTWTATGRGCPTGGRPSASRTRPRSCPAGRGRCTNYGTPR